MKEEAKKELIQWGLAIGMTYGLSLIKRAADAKIHANKLEKLGEVEYKKWAIKEKEKKEKVAVFAWGLIKAILAFGVGFAIVQGIVSGDLNLGGFGKT